MTTTTSINNANTQTRATQGLRFYIKRGLLVVLIILIALPVIGFGYETVMASSDARNYPPPGKMVDVDGHQMHLYCTGEGSPTVVMDAGLGGWSLDWSLVQPELAQTTRVCSYDRAGMGWSDPSPQPRDAQHAVQELHTLLANSGEAGPFVLVGHSNGGFRMLAYAAQYSQEVASLVLVDPSVTLSSEEQIALFSESEQQELLAMGSGGGAGDGGLSFYEMLCTLQPFGVSRLLSSSLLPTTAYAHLSADVQPAFSAGMNNGTFFGAYIAEIQQRENSRTQAHAVQTLGDLPLMILSNTHFGVFNSDPVPPEVPTRAVELAQKQLYLAHLEMSKLSSSGQVEQVAQAAHYIQIDRPDAVIQAIQSKVQS